VTNVLHTTRNEMSIGGIFNVMVNFKPGEYMRKMFLFCSGSMQDVCHMNLV